MISHINNYHDISELYQNLHPSAVISRKQLSKGPVFRTHEACSETAQ